mmetsp:Transcript_59254/g.128569  ORF Transcript_59254/g.128569 Transcript_59254/m.128569 type:complete len:213 (+) Transcript_59254:146-784(+)
MCIQQHLRQLQLRRAIRAPTQRILLAILAKTRQIHLATLVRMAVRMQMGDTALVALRTATPSQAASATRCSKHGARKKEAEQGAHLHGVRGALLMSTGLVVRVTLLLRILGATATPCNGHCAQMSSPSLLCMTRTSMSVRMPRHVSKAVCRLKRRRRTGRPTSRARSRWAPWSRGAHAKTWTNFSRRAEIQATIWAGTQATSLGRSGPADAS